MAKIIGGTQYIQKLNRLTSDMEPRVLAALMSAGRDIQRDAVNSLNEGAVSGPAHVPSAPGEPPNSDTHRLADSIEVIPDGPTRVLVVASTPYAAAQEFGNSRLPERPYMRPALAKNRSNISNKVKAAVGKETKGY